VSVHDGINEKVTSGNGRGGLGRDHRLSMCILDGVIGGDVRGGVFPNQPFGRRLADGQRRCVDSLVDGEQGEQGEGALDHVHLAVWSLFFHVDAEGGVSVPVVDVCWWGDKGCCAKNGLPGAPEHPEMSSCSC